MNQDLDENRIIGELLISKGIVSRNQVTSALYIQGEKPHLRIGEVLLSMGLITIEELDRVLREHLSQQFIGSLLLSHGFMSQEQLAEAMATQEKTNQRLGEIAINLGYVTQYQLTAILEKQRLLRRPHLAEMDEPLLGKKKTKLVATIGPSCASDEIVEKLMLGGVNIFRLNFSHGKHAEHLVSIERIRRVSQKLGITIGILQDIQGPKIRIGDVEGDEVELKAGSTFKLVTTPVTATAEIASVTYPRLLQDIKQGAIVLIDDGRLEVVVEAVTTEALVTRVKVGGKLKPRKGVNFPGTPLGISIITDKDKEDLKFGAQHNIDLVAASFVQSAADVLEVKAFLAEHGSKSPIIAKIERREAVYALQEILAVADGVMVARGDLGVEMPSEDVPLIQKQIIRQANIAGRPVITATQMLDSMINAPRPTRAEASDVANAILDGTDAVMLSNETAAGNYPLEAVATMCRIIAKTEHMQLGLPKNDMEPDGHRQLSEAITGAVTHLATEINAAAIVVPSFSGATARLVSKYRPRCLIIATSSSQKVCRQMMLVWGVYPLHLTGDSPEELHPETVSIAMSQGLLNPGDLLVVMESVTGAAGRSRGLRVEKAPAI
jgi:pyruvate kinase